MRSVGDQRLGVSFLARESPVGAKSGVNVLGKERVGVPIPGSEDDMVDT